MDVTSRAGWPAMDWMEFTASLVASIAWPLAVVCGAVLFRGEVKGLLQRMTAGKVLGTEWTFGQGIENVELARADLGQAQPSENGDGGLADPRLQVLALETASTNPSYAVLSSWEMVLAAVHGVTSTLGPDETQQIGKTRSNELAVLKRLRDRGAIEQTIVEMYVALRNLRDQVAHGQSSPTVGEAVAFVEQADWLIFRLRRLAETG